MPKAARLLKTIWIQTSGCSRQHEVESWGLQRQSPVLGMCLPSLLEVAGVALGQLCPSAGARAARWPHGVCATLRMASSSCPGRQRLLNLTHAGKDSGRLMLNSWAEWNMPKGFAFCFTYSVQRKVLPKRSPWEQLLYHLGLLFETRWTKESFCRSCPLLTETESLVAGFTVPVCTLENWMEGENVYRQGLPDAFSNSVMSLVPRVCCGWHNPFIYF